MTGRLSHRDLTILGAVLIVGIAAALWWLLVAPARSDSAEQGARLAAVEREINGLNDSLGRLRDAEPGAARRTAERLRLAKAVPAGAQVPAALVQLQRTADRAGVEFTSVTAGAVTPLGTLTGRDFELVVTGRFHDVDDFLYRLHALVTVSRAGAPSIEGRLIAVRDVSLTPAGDGGRTTLGAGERVTAQLSVVAYSAPADGAPEAASTQAPSTTTPTTPADPATTAPSPAASPQPAQADGVAEGGTGDGREDG